MYSHFMLPKPPVMFCLSLLSMSAGHPEESLVLTTSSPKYDTKTCHLFALPSIMLGMIMDFACDFSWVGSCQRAAADLADYAVSQLQAHQEQALLQCFRFHFNVPCKVKEETKAALRSLLACVRFTCTFERKNPCAVVRFIHGLSDCLHDSEAGVRMGAFSLLKEMAERRGKHGKLHRLIAKSMLELLDGGFKNLSEGDKERAMSILGTCKDLGRFGRPVVSVLLTAARKRQRGAASALMSVLQAEPLKKHPSAMKFVESAESICPPKRFQFQWMDIQYITLSASFEKAGDLRP